MSGPAPAGKTAIYTIPPEAAASGPPEADAGGLVQLAQAAHKTTPAQAAGPTEERYDAQRLVRVEDAHLPMPSNQGPTPRPWLEDT